MREDPRDSSEELVEQDPAPEPEQEASAGELRKIVSSFRQELEETEGRIFDLRFGEEQDQEQTASALGLSVYKVRKLERKLRRRLLAQLKKHGYLTERNPQVALNALLSLLLS